MINANELKLGNWIISAGTGELHPVQITIDNLRQLVESPGYGSPIYLTPEILIACGFENGRLGKYKAGYDSDDFIKAQMSFVFDSTMIKIKYLHQLQNLFWCLVGEELKIDLH